MNDIDQICITERKYWNTASLLKFFDHGHELTGDPHMLNLIIERIPADQARQEHSVKGKKQTESEQVGGRVKVRSYYAAIALRCRTAPSCTESAV